MNIIGKIINYGITLAVSAGGTALGKAFYDAGKCAYLVWIRKDLFEIKENGELIKVEA